ncbi:MAG: 4-hydroxy-tetrahydrodipicolinate synthase [Candidatus Altiarchaeota archaeon]
MNSKYCGCWTALVTPFDERFSVDWGQLERNVKFQVKEGVAGVLSMGTTGESPTVTHSEHSRITENTVDYVEGKCKVLAGTGSNSTDEAVFETMKAVDAGADACLLVDCYYNKPSSLELRKEYYSVILSEFPEMEFITYSIPGRSVTVMLPEDIAILRSQYKNLVAVKEASGDFERMRRIRELLDRDFNIMSGDDPNTYKMMTDPKIVSSGVISVISNITPGPIEKYTRLILAGKVKEAAEIDAALSPLFNIVGVKTTEDIKVTNGKTAQVTYKFPNPVPIKTMMNGLGMITGLCKRPHGKMTKNGVNIVRGALQEVWSKNPKMLEPIEGYYDVKVEQRLSDDRIWDKLSY